MNRPFMSTKLIDLFDRLRSYKVETFLEEYAMGEYEKNTYVNWRDADVVTSELKTFNHIVALDIDYDAHLLPSSTPGHWHLYLDVPGGIPNRQYMKLLKQLSKCGVIEPGYYRASKKRGHTALRRPGGEK